jgi:5-methylcytosine-specific restriction endonuclease McrA
MAEENKQDDNKTKPKTTKQKLTDARKRLILTLHKNIRDNKLMQAGVIQARLSSHDIIASISDAETIVYGPSITRHERYLFWRQHHGDDTLVAHCPLCKPDKTTTMPSSTEPFPVFKPIHANAINAITSPLLSLRYVSASYVFACSSCADELAPDNNPYSVWRRTRCAHFDLARLETWVSRNGLSAKTICPCCYNANIQLLTSEWHVSHITPRSHGGDDSLDNMVPACASCNLAMSTSDLNDFMATLSINDGIPRPTLPPVCNQTTLMVLLGALGTKSLV